MKYRREIKIAIIAVSAFALFFWGYNFLKGKNVFNKDRTVYAIYDDISGLEKSNNVLINGLKVGSVENVGFIVGDEQHRLLVTINLQDPIDIPVNSVAEIYSALIGNPAIRIVLGSSTDMIEDKDTIRSKLQVSIEDEVSYQMLPLKLKAEKMMLSIDSVMAVIQYVFNEDSRNDITRSIASIRTTLTNLQSTTTSIDAVVKTEATRLSNIIKNVESITANLEDHNDQIQKTIANLSAISDTIASSNISSTLLNANDALADFSVTMNKVSKGDGSLGMLIHDDSLYLNLEKSANDLDALLIDLKKNPDRYLKVSVFGGKKKSEK